MESPFKETISKLPFEGLCDMRAPGKYLETNKSKQSRFKDAEKIDQSLLHLDRCSLKTKGRNLF